ncbi:MAG TPA: deoxyribodipyrimidine photo-lyase, partial [Candidatus Mcinerneyibacterium sp.]|nr:deoxyribodipyrimidine photo-lyase [Candidatus Mcinerneyibacterium sp.]
MRIKKERVREYLKKPINKQGNYVLYWMQRSQRATSNHALDLSIKYANEFDLPLLILFIVLNKYPESNERHYYFMLEGLREVEKNINNAGGNFVIKYENDKEIKKIFENASIIIFDKGYTKFEKQLRENKAKKATQKIYEVESDLIVPVEAASDKEEYAAYTIRKKLNNLRNNFLNYNKNPEKLNNTGKIEFNSLNICNIEEFFKNLNINKEVRKSQYFTGGRKEALNKLDTFIENKLEYYEEFSNDPTKNYISNLSP